MTPPELYAAMNLRRRALGLAWWEVAVAVDTGDATLRAIKYGRLSGPVRRRVLAWLARRPDPPRKE